MARTPETTPKDADAPRREKRAKSVGKTASNTIVWVVLLMVILGLGGYGAVNFSGNVRSVGSVGDTPIPVSRYQRQLSLQMNQIQQQLGLQLSFTQAEQFGLDRAALETVVNQVALEDEAHRMGLSAGDEEVRRRLLQIGAFQDFSGKFDPEMYRDTLKRSNIGVSEFEDELRATAARDLLTEAVETGAEMPAAQAETMYQWAAERRSFIWAELSASDLRTAIPAPTDEALQAYYEANADAYTLPETRAITYAWITPTALVDKIDIDEDALRQLYDARSDEYNVPERRLVERLVFGSDEEAVAAKARLDANEIDFDALVTERGLTLEDVNLDEQSRADLGSAGDAVFALTQPGVVGPVQTDLGPALFRVNAILNAQSTSFEEVRDELADAYAADNARRQIDDMREEVDDLLAGGATLEEVAADTPLELGTVNWTPNDSDGIAGYSAFRDAAEAAGEGDYPEVVALDDGGIFALRLDRIVPPTLQPYAEVSDRVREDWTRDTTRAALEALADELLPRIQSGENPGSFGLSTNHEDGLTRDAFLADVPEGLVAKAFELPEGEAARINGTEGTATVAIVQTTEVLPPDPENQEMAQARDQYQQQLDEGLRQDLLDAYTRTVAARAGISVDQGAVNAVNAQFR